MGFFDNINPIKIVTDAIGGFAEAQREEKNFDRNVALQREFANNGIRWKVEDAKRAGIHPLYALGSQPASFSPVAVQGGHIADTFDKIGSNIDRARQAGQTSLERLQERLLSAQVEGQEIDNAYKASQYSRLNRSAQLGPPMPGGGKLDMLPAEVTHHANQAPSVEFGPASPAIKYFEMPDGSVVAWPSAAAKASIEDSPYEYEHIWHTRTKPWLHSKYQQFSEWWNTPSRRANHDRFNPY